MWSRVVQIAFRAQIQHRRIQAAAIAVLLLRWLQGLACWVIIYGFFIQATLPVWVVHLNFIVYGLANLALFVAHRREALTPSLVWLDIIVNLLPMAAAAHWSGGIYSPLLPVFVVKIGGYGLIYGADVGLQSLAATAVTAAGLVLLERGGFSPADSIDQVPLLVRARLALAFEGLTFGILVGGSLRFFRILQDRENRLAVVAREKDALYQESVRHQHALRSLSRKMMQVGENTMRRLARELHDDLGQALTAVRMDLGLIDRTLETDSPVRPHVREVRDQIGGVLQSVRNLSQLLRPAVLDDLGLVPAMQSYITNFGERTRILITLDAPIPDTRLPRPIEVTLYRVLQEALTNVARHANAQRVHVRLQTDSNTVTLQISDDGCGFDAPRFLENPPSDRGMGLIGMRERAATYGGRLTIESHVGGGTRIELTLSPAEPAEEPEEEHEEDSRLVG